MNGRREILRKLRAADPAASSRVEALELGPAEASLEEGILAEPRAEAAAGDQAGYEPLEPRERPDLTPPAWRGGARRGRRRGLLGLAGAVAALAAALVIVLLAGGGSDSAGRAYGAELVRFAESTPLLLLEGPGWRVQNVTQQAGGQGQMEFVTGKSIPYETRRFDADGKVTGFAPASVRRRKVELEWWSLDDEQRPSTKTGGLGWVELPVLDTTADVDTRVEVIPGEPADPGEPGGPGDRYMSAFWSDGTYALNLRGFVPDLEAFAERLGWLTRVDSQTWLDAMPAKVVKAADHDAAVREMLRGIPVPNGFSPRLVPDEGVTTNRYQVGAAVTATVTCLWFRQWGNARRVGDPAARLEAARAMATSKRWPILREMARDGDLPALIRRLAESMPGGVWVRGPKRTQRLLPKVEGLNCARLGVPVLPWKQRRQEGRAAEGKPPVGG